MTKAVVDVGSNSVLLSVGTLEDGVLKTVLETSAVTGLGRGTKETGVLSEEGMSDTLVALRAAFRAADGLGSAETVAAATMAARIAHNAGEFLERARSQGTPVSVLSGDDEAAFGFLAVAQDPHFAEARRLSIIDVGGHSTEVSTSARTDDAWRCEHRKSYAVGALGLRGSLLKADPAGPGDLLAAAVEVDDTFGFRALPHSCGTVVTLGATGTNLVTVRKQMARWDPAAVHGAWLGYEDVSRAVDTLCSLDDAGRAALVGLEKGREHTVHAGALILERALFALGAEGCYVSVNGWRSGLLMTRLLAE
ncbi:MAG: hypothetical protein JST30_02475 [Armatimonadetes bacterium]|nr:hypothetical protein [Armatimonadota bacterium]